MNVIAPNLEGDYYGCAIVPARPRPPIYTSLAAVIGSDGIVTVTAQDVREVSPRVGSSRRNKSTNPISASQ